MMLSWDRLGEQPVRPPYDLLSRYKGFSFTHHSFICDTMVSKNLESEENEKMKKNEHQRDLNSVFSALRTRHAIATLSMKILEGCGYAEKLETLI